MAKKDRSQFRAGLFIVASIVLLLLVTVAIKGVSTVFVPTDEQKVRFSLTDDLGGLRVGDDVRIGGFKVGVVRKIELHGMGSDQQPSLLVTFSMPKEYPVRADAHIAIQTTVTGTSVLNIDALGTGQTLKDGEELTGHPSGLSALLASAGDAGPELRDLVHTMKTETVPRFTTAAAKATETLASIRAFADHASEMSTQVGSLFGDTKPDFRGTMANLNAITTDAKAKLPGLLQHADDVMVKAGDTVDNARAAMVDVKATAANLKDVSDNARGVVSGNRGKFDNIVASLKQTADNLKGASADIRRSPWRVLYHPGPGELDNLELYDATRQFAEGANNVNDAAVALKDAMKDPKTDPQQVQKLIDQLNSTFANFNAVEQKLWKTVKAE